MSDSRQRMHTTSQRPASPAQQTPAPQTPVAEGTALQLPPSIPLEEWQDIGRKIFGAADSTSWWLGDWLAYGRSTYPDRYRRAVEETLLDYQTLRNYAWVSRRYAPRRRRATLSFQHHAELASLPEAEQEYWMDRAERLNWSKSFLRNRVRAARQGEEPAAVEARVDIHLNLPQERRTRWSQAASAAEQDLQSWAMSMLDDAAAHILRQDEAA
ncbi:LmbU family transcriptional regulator [Streptomyces lunaelactis]|uniref:LmbU family transcriptional regulator n=1 Tax=Streptomyces lunaelactis TaxID=1535768 RepID=UPI001C30B2B1|nr:LmbU family transcriptional regulator [Streptomyces lunaelactis]